MGYTFNILNQLKEKYPPAQEAQHGSLHFGPVLDIPDVVYQKIDGEMVREAALRTKGSGGPCGVDTLGFRRNTFIKIFQTVFSSTV